MDDIVRLFHRGLGVREYSLAAAHAIRRVIPFDGVCVLTLDPATLLPTGHVIENGLPEETFDRYAQIEVAEPDVNKLADLARGDWRAATLSAATGGRLDRSLRHRELRAPNGFGDELRAALVSDTGAWGGIVLLRESRAPDFTPQDAAFLASLSAQLAEGLRHAMLHGSLAAGDEDPGLVVFGEDDAVELANPAARAWLDEVPVAIRAVALAARDGSAVARARVRTPAGQWLLLRGSLLGERAAVIVEPARAPELAPLIAAEYGLTPRERTVTELVAQGLPTDAISHRLHLSPYTVQDHLKAIFEKAGVGSRGELVAHLFFEHYRPRL